MIHRTHDLASMVGYGALKIADKVKESSVGRAKRQKSHPSILPWMFFKILSPVSPVKPRFYAQSFVRRLIVKVAYLGMFDCY